jgi:hypothetical protein
MYLWDVLAGGDEIQMLSEFYADTEVAVGPAGTGKRNMMRLGAPLLICAPYGCSNVFVAELPFAAEAGSLSEVCKWRTFFVII